MDYKQAEEYILSFTDYEKIPGILYTSANYDLRRMAELLAPLGNPHLAAKTVHIAGTKGKGSTAAMIAQVLTTSVYKTGLYTSPHLHTLRERIRIDGNFISEADFVSLVEILKPLVTLVNEKGYYGQLTTFEILTALAFTYFAKEKVDFQVVEVGLGGRLDATNVVKPEVCVITSISLDHTEVLGDTIGKIAAEKAGIIKEGCLVVSAPQPPEAKEVIQRVCQEKGAKLIQVGEDITWRKISSNLGYQSFLVNSREKSYYLTIPLLGDHQLENAANAVAVFEALASLGAKISVEDIRKGLAQVNWPGRLQILSYQPFLVVDGAHNAYSMKRLVQAVRDYFDYDRCFVIFGTSCDKDIPGMVAEIISLSTDIFITRSSHPRAASLSILAKEFANHGIQVNIVENTFEALSYLLTLASPKDLILVTGSLFLIAEAINYTQKLKGGGS